MRRVHFLVIAIAASVLVTSAGAGMAEAQSDVAFKRGIKEAERKPTASAPTNWKQVAADMREALSADPLEGRRVGAALTFGGTPYLPHFFLGEALYHLNRWAEALNEFDESVKQLRVQKTSYNTKLPGYYAGCQRQGYLLAEEIASANSQFAAARAQAGDAVGAFEDLDFKHREAATRPEFLSRNRDLKAALNEADRAQIEAQKSRKRSDFQRALQRVNDVKNEVLRLVDAFQTYLDRPQPIPQPNPTTSPTADPAPVTELAARRNEAEAGFKTAQSRIDKLNQRVKERPAASRNGPSVNMALAEARRVLKAGLQNLNTAGSDLNLVTQCLSDLKRVIRKLDEVESLMRSMIAPSTVPDGFKEGATAFFIAQYQRALDALTPEVADATGATIRPHIFVIRAAAYLALYDLGGRVDKSLLARATAEVQECKQMQTDFEPNASAFSPRFVQFFRAIRP